MRKQKKHPAPDSRYEEKRYLRSLRQKRPVSYPAVPFSKKKSHIKPVRRA